VTSRTLLLRRPFKRRLDRVDVVLPHHGQLEGEAAAGAGPQPVPPLGTEDHILQVRPQPRVAAAAAQPSQQPLPERQLRATLQRMSADWTAAQRAESAQPCIQRCQHGGPPQAAMLGPPGCGSPQPVVHDKTRTQLRVARTV